MTDRGVEVEGLDTFRTTAAAAARDLDHLDRAHQRAGDLLLDQADPPVESGDLAASLYVIATADDTTVGSDLIYATVIHWGWPERGIEPNPFLTDDLDRNTAAVVDFFLDDLTEAVHSIRGA